MKNILTGIQDEVVRFINTVPRELLLALAALVALIFICALIVWIIRRNRSQTKALGPEEEIPDTVAADAEVDVESEIAVPAPSGVEAESEIPVPAPADAEAEPEVQAPSPVEAPEPADFFSRLKNGLKKTRSAFSTGLDKVFSGNRKIDDALFEDIEELLITSDVGVQTAMDLVQNISKGSADISTASDFQAALKDEILTSIEAAQAALDSRTVDGLNVILVVGVNGVGKTTTIGKLAARFSREGKRVLIVAADTFRAAAIEQLAIWSEKAGADLVKHKHGSDPAAVAYDGIEAAAARGVDVVLVDTAGRLHTKVNLMEELKKIKRTIAKKLPDAPHETLLVLDATTGQNALAQAKLFHEAFGVTGIALTKLDGTAKGGIVISICNTLSIPLQYIGVGEQIDDLQDFEARPFVDALF
jgi:fused signal recognition particle receptor